MGFFGTLSGSRYIEKYERELASILCHEIMVRISNGTALNVVGGIISPFFLMEGVVAYLEAGYNGTERWGDSARLHSFQLARAVEHKCSLHETLRITSKLGENLEACGLFSKAGRVYAETAKLCYNVKHPLTCKFLRYAGLAWKHDDDREKAESYYAASIHCTKLQHDHVEYSSELIRTLANLWSLWYDLDTDGSSMNRIFTLRALLMGAIDRTNDLWNDPRFIKINGIVTLNVPILRSAYGSASKDDFCRALHFITIESTSVDSMKAAIMKFRDPLENYTSVSVASERVRNCKDDARDYMRGQYFVEEGSSDFILSCDDCGKMKDQNALKKCPWYESVISFVYI